jgi:hypothetical protein
MTTFGKTKDCPTSWELLDLASGHAVPDRERKLVRHLGVCDFCAAELEMYMDFPPMFERVDAPPMPEPLRELAESTLTRASVRSARLEGLLKY